MIFVSWLRERGLLEKFSVLPHSATSTKNGPGRRRNDKKFNAIEADLRESPITKGLARKHGYNGDHAIKNFKNPIEICVLLERGNH